MSWTMSDRFFWVYGRELPWVAPEDVYTPNSDWEIINEVEDTNGEAFTIVKHYYTEELGYTSL